MTLRMATTSDVGVPISTMARFSFVPPSLDSRLHSPRLRTRFALDLNVYFNRRGRRNADYVERSLNGKLLDIETGSAAANLDASFRYLHLQIANAVAGTFQDSAPDRFFEFGQSWLVRFRPPHGSSPH